MAQTSRERVRLYLYSGGVVGALDATISKQCHSDIDHFNLLATSL